LRAHFQLGERHQVLAAFAGKILVGVNEGHGLARMEIDDDLFDLAHLAVVGADCLVLESTRPDEISGGRGRRARL
jgi:hypothetical protein